MPSKQVLVMRKMDKGCRTGKYCSQAAHASLGALLSIASIENDSLVIPLSNPFIREWITGRFTKITLQVSTDEELVSLYNLAKAANIPTSLIKDAGLTEFNGIPTLTALGIGPYDAVEIDKITSHLPLF